MKWYNDNTRPDNLRFIIEEDSSVGFYLYVYESNDLFEADLGTDALCSRHQQDHLQDTLEMAQKCANRMFGVPFDSWLKIEK